MKPLMFLRNLFCMPGSWNWARNQMVAGYIVRSSVWTSNLKMRLNPETKWVEVDFSENEKDAHWVTAPRLSESLYASVINYEIFKWERHSEVFIYPDDADFISRMN